MRDASDLRSHSSVTGDQLPDRPEDMTARPADAAAAAQSTLRRAVGRAARREPDRRDLFRFRAEFAVGREAPPSREIAGAVDAGAQHVIEYHLIARGSCWGHAVGQPPIRLREGDVIVFPQRRRTRAVERARHARGARSVDVQASADVAAGVLRVRRRRARPRARHLLLPRVRRPSLQSAARRAAER